jgi:hypothetical protein
MGANVPYELHSSYKKCEEDDEDDESEDEESEDEESEDEESEDEEPDSVLDTPFN